jgi:hypothetical protein
MNANIATGFSAFLMAIDIWLALLVEPYSSDTLDLFYSLLNDRWENLVVACLAHEILENKQCLIIDILIVGLMILGTVLLIIEIAGIIR